MPEFSQRSLDRLKGVHPDLITILNYVVKDFDCTVLEGLRTQERQQELYALGRGNVGQIVTYCDGVNNRSRHQDGRAVDLAPWPLNWKDTDRFRNLGWYVKGVARMLKQYGAIDSDITWGGDFVKFTDLPHYEI